MQIHSRHILVQDEKTAKEVLQQLKAGKKFEELARKYSQDESNKLKGGDLGWATKDMYDPAFGNAAFALKKPGELSGPVKSSFGWHIIQLLERDEKRPLTAEQRQQLGQEQLTEFIQQQRKRLQSEDKLQLSIPPTPTTPPVQTPGTEAAPTATG